MDDWFLKTHVKVSSKLQGDGDQEKDAWVDDWFLETHVKISPKLQGDGEHGGIYKTAETVGDSCVNVRKRN